MVDDQPNGQSPPTSGLTSRASTPPPDFAEFALPTPAFPSELVAPVPRPQRPINTAIAINVPIFHYTISNEKFFGTLHAADNASMIIATIDLQPSPAIDEFPYQQYSTMLRDFVNTNNINLMRVSSLLEATRQSMTIIPLAHRRRGRDFFRLVTPSERRSNIHQFANAVRHVSASLSSQHDDLLRMLEAHRRRYRTDREALTQLLQNVVNYITNTLLPPNDAFLDYFGATAIRQGKIMCDLFLHTWVTLVATESTSTGQVRQTPLIPTTTAARETN